MGNCFPPRLNLNDLSILHELGQELQIHVRCTIVKGRACRLIERVSHSGAKLRVLFSSGKNNILRTSAARKILFLTHIKKLMPYLQATV